jgi:hypothetical protein
MRIRLTEESMRGWLMEEMTKGEISSLIARKLGDNMNSQDFKKKVKEIAADVVSELFKILWQRNSFWKSSAISC